MTQSEAITILKTGTNVFLTGEPGSGKTYTINKYVKYLRSHAIEPAITASTGIAATHIGGMTIHSWSGIGISEKLSDQEITHIASKNYVDKRIKDAHVLIIDEISMLSSNTLNLVERVCRKVKNNKSTFGGIQVVLVGDFFQLPPISKNNDGPVFAFESKTWEALNLDVCYLSEQHRQNDEEFLSLLKSLRSGNVEEEHYTNIQNRILGRYDLDNEVTKLFSHNRDVDSINSRMLSRIESKTINYKMKSYGKRKIVDALIKGCISPEILSLKLGAIVMFTKNNQKQGFVNGTLGKVIDFNNFDLPIVKTKNGRNIVVGPMEWTVEDGGAIIAGVSQLPLRLAWAITIHKSQGMSMDAAIMDLSQVFEYGQGYVALSRVRTLAGLFLIGCNNQALMVHPTIVEIDQEFKVNSKKTLKNIIKDNNTALQKTFDEFIVKCNGSLKEQAIPIKQKPTKTNTYNETLTLVHSTSSISEIAKKRKLTYSTILSHLEKLISDDKITDKDVAKFLDSKLKKELVNIHSVFRKLDTTSLSPVRSKLKNKFSYDDLRLARMLLKNKEML